MNLNIRIFILKITIKYTLETSIIIILLLIIKDIYLIIIIIKI